MLDRRGVLVGVATLLSSMSLALAQSNTPKLFILAKGVTSPVRFITLSSTLTNISLEGFLVCNGAAVSRTDYKELFEAVETRYGAGDGVSTFALPNYPVQYRSDCPIKGMAICPSRRLGLPVGVVAPFDTDNQSKADTSQKPQ